MFWSAEHTGGGAYWFWTCDCGTGVAECYGYLLGTEADARRDWLKHAEASPVHE